MSHARWTTPLLAEAQRLRARGLSYGAIAVVLDEYHELGASAGAVRQMLRSRGAAPRLRGQGSTGLLRGGSEGARAC